MTSNPLRILQVLDRHLTRDLELYVYGRSALALGFPSAPAFLHATMDVDAILPTRDLKLFEANEDFWRAQELTNAELGDSGLYFTHLFEERQVILAPGWLDRVHPLPVSGLRLLRLYRPATEDLILTKMMRVDPQDRADILFLTEQTDFSRERLQAAVGYAAIPDVPELRKAFEVNKLWLLEKLLCQ